jgi:ATP-dependent DNA ligase
MDCKIVGFNEGEKKYTGMLGSLQIRIPVGCGKWSERISNISGMSDDDRVYMWKNRKKLLGTIVEVEYRKISGKGKLIEGHVYRPRPDKE